MKLETERLILIPLTAEELELWIKDISTLEKKFNFSYQGDPIEGVFYDIVKGQLSKTENDQENYMWHSFWLILRKADRIVVGSADFKDVPSLEGEVEIGYGLEKAFENKGYMTETVKAMCSWALKQKGVKHVIAETELDNIPSQRVLKSSGFVEYFRDETVWWRL